MASRHRVVDHIVEHLAASGVDYIFGVDGANIEDLYDAAFFRADITAVLAKHEFSAATMADGYSRSGAGLGVVAATSGGGCLNTVPGLGESFASRVPVLALIGQPPTTMDGRGSFQDTSGRNGALNAEALFSAVSVFCRRVVTPAGHRLGAARGDRGGANRWSGSVVAAQGHSAGRGRSPTAVSADSSRPGHSSVIHRRSRALCAAPTGRSRSSPASRSPATTPASNSSSCGRCCAPGSPRCPTPRTSQAHQVSDRRRRWVSPE